MFKYLDKDGDNVLLKEDITELEQSVWNVCQRFGNLINSDKDVLQTFGRAIVKLEIIDDISNESFEFVEENGKITKSQFKNFI